MPKTIFKYIIKKAATNCVEIIHKRQQRLQSGAFVLNFDNILIKISEWIQFFSRKKW